MIWLVPVLTVHQVFQLIHQHMHLVHLFIQVRFLQQRPPLQLQLQSVQPIKHQWVMAYHQVFIIVLTGLTEFITKDVEERKITKTEVKWKFAFSFFHVCVFVCVRVGFCLCDCACTNVFVVFLFLFEFQTIHYLLWWMKLRENVWHWWKKEKMSRLQFEGCWSFFARTLRRILPWSSYQMASNQCVSSKSCRKETIYFVTRCNSALGRNEKRKRKKNRSKYSTPSYSN